MTRGDRVDLESFLSGLTPEAAAKARVAAAEIDQLDRATEDLRPVERFYARLALATAGLFIIGALALLGELGPAPGLRGFFGYGGAVLLIASPALVGALYTFRVRNRTAADHRKMALNKADFLPHGGLYFPLGEAAEGGSEAAFVALTDWTPPKPRPPTREERIQEAYDKVGRKF